MARTGLLRHPEDLRSIAFVAASAVLSWTGWFFAPHHGPILVVWIVATAVACWIVAVITHNTVHSPVFHSRTLNKMFQVWLSLSYGFPVSEYLPGHNLSHHKHMQKGADLMRTSKVRYRWNLLNAIAFVPSVAFSVTLANLEFARTVGKTRPGWLRQLRMEIAIVWGVKIALLFLDWRKALLFVFIPHVFAVWGITAVNFVQHDGCDEDHPYNHARNFVGGWFNWLTFNNGFHGMHHIQPGLHWSLLAKMHAERVHPHIHPSLEQRSLAVYLFKTFIFPGKRIDYQGRPLEVTERPEEDFLKYISGGEATEVTEA